MPTPLTPSDRQKLNADSWIDAATAQAFGLYRVDTFEGADLVGGDPNKEDYTGVVFSGYRPGESQPRTQFLRRDNPTMEKNKDGVLKAKGKYVVAKGERNKISTGPDESVQVLTDAQITAVFTEGAKKLLALWRLARHDSEQPRFLALALSGVHNWRGKIGTVVNPNGKKVDEKGVIPDFDRIAWAGRQVVIVFDSDVATNEKVAAARRGLVAELRRRGAKVAVVDLPALAELEITGLDDYVARKGPKAALALIQTAIQNPVTASKPERTSQATQLIQLAGDAALWHTPDGEAFASIRVADHHEHYRLRSKEFKQWLAKHYYQHSNGAPSAQGVNDALAVLEAQAYFDGKECPVHVRVAEYDGVIYLDLANETWEAVAITSTGWHIVHPPVAFRRSRGMLALPIPQPGGNVDRLKSYLNLDPTRETDWTLLVACVLAMFRPRGPYPVIILHGEQGSAKSTLVRVLRMLLDPNKSLLRTSPRDERDLMIAANNGWVLAYDNLSHLEPWLSDGFCRLSTGGGLGTRQLYSDADELILEAQRPVIINGIEELATRGDLLDRAALFYLPTITKETRRTEADFWEEFEQDRPYILGALLDVVCGAMHELPSTKLPSLPRLADFATWATAAEKALGWTPGTFIKAYTANQKDVNEITLEASPITAPLKQVLALPSSKPSWSGTATKLLEELNGQADDHTKRLKGWPKKANGLSNTLRRLAPNLREANIDVTFTRDTGVRTIHIEGIRGSSSGSSGSSSPHNKQGLNNDDHYDNHKQNDDHQDGGADDMTVTPPHATYQYINGKNDSDALDDQIPIPSDEEVIDLAD